MTIGAIVAIVAVGITLIVQLLAVGGWVGSIKARLEHQDHDLKHLKDTSERQEGVLSRLAAQLELKFSQSAAGKPRRARKRS